MPYKKKSDYNKYMAEYMRDYRQFEREIIREAKKQFGGKFSIKKYRKRNGK